MDQPRELRQPAPVVDTERVLPVDVEVANEPGDVHKVERPIANHAVSDADIAAFRVTGPWLRAHELSIADARHLSLGSSGYVAARRAYQRFRSRAPHSLSRPNT